MAIKRRYTSVGRLPYHRHYGGGIATPPLRETPGGPPWSSCGGLVPIRLPAIKHNYGMHPTMRRVEPTSLIVGLLFVMHKEIHYQERHGFKSGFTTYLAKRIIREYRPSPMAATIFDTWNPDAKRFEPFNLMDAFEYHDTVTLPEGVKYRPHQAFVDPKLYATELRAIYDLYTAAEDRHDILFPWKLLKGRNNG